MYYSYSTVGKHTESDVSANRPKDIDDYTSPKNPAILAQPSASLSNCRIESAC